MELADILRAHEARFLDQNRSWLSLLSNGPCCERSLVAARRRWAAISIPVPDAAIRPSLITPAVTGIVRSARHKRVNDGSLRVSKKCSAYLTFTLFSLSRMN